MLGLSKIVNDDPEASLFKEATTSRNSRAPTSENDGSLPRLGEGEGDRVYRRGDTSVWIRRTEGAETARVLGLVDVMVAT